MSLSGESRASSPSSSAGGLAQQHYHKVLDLEQVLLTTIQSKGPFDPNVRILRGTIRELFEAIILEDHEFADSHDVEQSLWRLHHTCIEEFRGRIRKSTSSAGTANSPAAANTPTVWREPVNKILAVFRSFLSEATGFYHDLILKIRAKHGLSQDDFTYSAINGKIINEDDKRMLEVKRCQLSCHRCLIFLGDLARYKEFYTDGDAKKHDWSIAAGFYVKAASLWPASGNPYNQLAVLAMYIGDEMLAVYYYFRSLASENPFLAAKDNLVLLFEKNRHSYMRLVASSAGKPSQAGPITKGQIKGETQVTGEETAALKESNSPKSEQKASATDFLKSFQVHVVQLNGILFTRTSLETFAEVHSCVLSELEDLLNFSDMDEGVSSQVSLTSGRIWGTGPNILLQLISILIFTVHNINVGPVPDSHQPTYAEILQRSAVLEHAFIAIFGCVGLLIQRCVKMEDPSNCLLLPAVLVVMEWLSCRPEMAVGTDIKEKEGNARMLFWKNCVDLLNTGAFGGVVSNEVNEGPVLWEDFELWGFTPLLPIHHKLDYTKKPAVGLGSSQEKHVRVKRLKHAGKVISNMFKGTDKGMHYDADTDSFYMIGHKKHQERKVAYVVASAETIESCANLAEEHKDSQTLTDPDLILAKLTASIEEEDEEVIVFKPSNKLTKPIDTALWDDILPYRSSKFVSNTTQSDTWVSLKSMPVSQAPSHLAGIEALPTMVTSVPRSLSNNNVQVLLSEPASLAADVTGASKDSGRFLAMKSTGLDAIPEHGSHISSPTLVDGLGLLNSISKASGNEYDHGLLSGSTVDWGSGTGFGMFQNQPSGNFIPAAVNRQPQDFKGGSFLWNSELHRLASTRDSFRVSPINLTVGTNKRFPFIDSSPGSLHSMVLPSATHNLSETLCMPTLSMGNHVLDAHVQTKSTSEVPELVNTDSNLGPIQVATQDLNISGAKLKPDPGLMNDSEKPSRRTVVSSSGMRPPPGFGPLPIRPPVSLSDTSVLQVSQLTSGGHPSSTMGQQKISAEQSGAPSLDEHIDDYGWLDGYTPPNKETSQPVASGLGRTGGSSSYGWSTGRFNSALDATISSFPGMNPSDCFLSPPPQLPPLPHAFLQQQELLRKQQTQEHYQQLLQEHQRQQLQQLYNVQLAAQRNHLQQVECLNQQQPLQQQPVGLQQQMPQPLWPGQNSFVS